MSFSEISDELERGTLSLSNEELVSIVSSSCMKDYYIDCDRIKDVISHLQALRKANIDEFNEAKKEEVKKNAAAFAEVGTKYFHSLPVGSPVMFRTAAGVLMEATVGETKGGAKCAHVVLNQIPAGSKRPDRYVPFERIVVPDGII